MAFLLFAFVASVTPGPSNLMLTAAGAQTSIVRGLPCLLVQAVSLACLFVFVALPSCFLWLAFGAAVQRVLHTRRRVRIFNVALGGLLALSTVLILR